MDLFSGNVEIPEDVSEHEPSDYYMDELTAIFAGVGLAAACGFRVFVPLFIASLGANLGVGAVGGVNFQDMPGAEFKWLGSTPITIALGVATVCEIGGYYIPWLDNALDAMATPAAVLAGIFISGAMLPEFIGDGSLKWIVATVVRGGSAGVVQGASAFARGTSFATTGGWVIRRSQAWNWADLL